MGIDPTNTRTKAILKKLAILRIALSCRTSRIHNTLANIRLLRKCRNGPLWALKNLTLGRRYLRGNQTQKTISLVLSLFQDKSLQTKSLTVTPLTVTVG